MIFFHCIAANAGLKPARSVPGQILIKPKPGFSETNLLALIRQSGASHRHKFRRTNIRVLGIPEDQVSVLLSVLKRNPNIEFVERDYVGEATYLPNDSYFVSGTEWHPAKIQAPQAWDITRGRSDTIVAILDSGINAAHPDLQGKVLPGYDFVWNDNDPSDDFGHGTAVAGTVVASGNNGIGVAGIAFGCRVLPVKVLDSSGFATYSAIAEGIRYAVDRGARVINISIAGDSPSSTLQEAINYAWSNNVVIVASAGNNSSAEPRYPAACAHVVSVAATQPDDSLAYFSNYGSSVSLSAPGDGIWTTQNNLNNPYGSWRGTSFASPVVAAVAGLIASENPSLSNEKIISILLQTADAAGPFGRVNAYRAVTAASLEPGALPPDEASALPPAVGITSPAGSAQISANATISLEAAALGDNGAAVTNVEFFANGASVGNSAPPFVLDWQATQPGNYSLTAIATDEHGLQGTSVAVSIRVLSPETVAPTVSLKTSPANGARVTLPILSLAGTAQDNTGLQGVLVQVNGEEQFFAQGTINWSAQIVLSPGNNVVKIRSVDLAGNVSAIISRTFNYVVTAPIAVRVDGLGKVSPDQNGKLLEIGKSYSIKAVPGVGQVFAGWDGINSDSPTLNLVMQSNLTLVAKFIPSPFPPVKGNYAGLLHNTNTVLPDNSGYFTMTVSAAGVFSAKLSVGGNRYSLSGKLNLDGDARVHIPRKLQTPLAATLHVDLANGLDQISGSVTDGSWTSEISGDRNVFSSKLNPAVQAGSGAIILERADDTAIAVATGTSKISTAGTTTVRGKLTDGRAFTASSTLAKNGDSPFYLSLSKGSEVVIGWLNFPAISTPPASGTVLWIKTGTNSFTATLQATSVHQ